jgi:hypothetical protein
MDNVNVPSWEASKENVLPIKKGRSVKGLSEALSRNVISENTNEKNQEKAFETELKTEFANAEDKLAVYIKYYKWIRDAFPTQSDKALKLLEVYLCFTY